MLLSKSCKFSRRPFPKISREKIEFFVRQKRRRNKNRSTQKVYKWWRHRLPFCFLYFSLLFSHDDISWNARACEWMCMNPNEHPHHSFPRSENFGGEKWNSSYNSKVDIRSATCNQRKREVPPYGGVTTENDIPNISSKICWRNKSRINELSLRCSSFSPANDVRGRFTGKSFSGRWRLFWKRTTFGGTW